MKTIIEIAKAFEGVKEKPNNSGFHEHPQVFALTGMHPEELFTTVGWRKGFAWCMFLPKVVWYLYYRQYDTSKALELLSVFGASVSQTFTNFKSSKLVEISKCPQFGAIAIWSLFKGGAKQWQGHTGIVMDLTLDVLYTMEGNTNAKGEREGTIVREKGRSYNFNDKEGLVLQGFILAPLME